MQIRYSHGSHAKDNRPQQKTSETFDAFEKTVLSEKSRAGILPDDTADELRVKKERIHYYSLALKSGATRRCAANVAESFSVRMDLDGTTTDGWAVISELLKSFRGFAYTTASHQHPTVNGEQRWRIFLEVSRPVNAVELASVSLAFEKELMSVFGMVCDAPVKWDSRVYNPAWILFGQDERAVSLSFHGRPVDIDALLRGAEVTGIAVQRDPAQINATGTDAVAEYLIAQGYAKDGATDGIKLPISCPFEDAHSTPGGETSTVYLLEQSGGFELGHFKCLHASCAHRNDGDYLNKIGYRDGDFDVIEAGKGESVPFPSFVRDKKGRIGATIDNVARAVMRPDFCGIQVRFDQFRDEIMFAPEKSNQWQAFGDPDYSRLRITLERCGFASIGRELIRDVVLLTADEQPFDSATVWLNGLQWDGIPRVEQFVHKCFGAEQSAYTTAVSVYMWTALAGRVLSPGCKADMVPIFVGAQGCGKSTGVAALSPDPAFFTEISFAEKDDDLARKMRGRLVGEIGELRGLHTKELESIKAFITRTHENWVPKYREFATQFPRRLMFFGTTNQDEFLADDTGNRRWLPVHVGTVDVVAIRADVLQLWAEARELFKKTGVYFRDAEHLATQVHERYTIKDAWAETVEHWLDTPDLLTGEKPRMREFLHFSDVLREAVGLDPRSFGKREEMRIGTVLRNCGYRKAQRRIGGKKYKVWVPSGTTSDEGWFR